MSAVFLSELRQLRELLREAKRMRELFDYYRDQGGETSDPVLYPIARLHREIVETAKADFRSLASKIPPL